MYTHKVPFNYCHPKHSLTAHLKVDFIKMRLLSNEMKGGVAASDEEVNPAIGKFKALDDSLDWGSFLSAEDKAILRWLFAKMHLHYLPSEEHNLYLWTLPKKWGGFGFFPVSTIEMPSWHAQLIHMFEVTPSSILR
jgi:hypothetical protein